MDHHHHMAEHGTQADDSTQQNNMDMPSTSENPQVSQRNAGHSEHNMMMGHSLAFHGGYTETILFFGWKIESIGGLIASMLGVFMMVIIYEGMKYYRDYLFWRAYTDMQYQAFAAAGDKNRQGGQVVPKPIKQRPSRLSGPHIIQTAMYTVQTLISFFLMLIFMTYNVYLCSAIIAGYAVGFFIFSWKKSVLVDMDVSETCH